MLTSIEMIGIRRAATARRVLDEARSPSNSMYDWWVRSRYPIELAPTPAPWASTIINMLGTKRICRLSLGPGDEPCCIV